MLIVLEKHQRALDIHFCNILRIFVLFFYTYLLYIFHVERRWEYLISI